MRRNFQSEISISYLSRRFALSYGISSWCHCLIFKNSAFLKPSLFLFIVEKSTSSSRTLGKVWNEFLEVQVHSVLSLQPISKLLLSPTISCRIIHESLFYLSRWTIDLNSSDSFAWDEVALRVTTWKSYSLREWFKVTTWMLHKQLMWLFNNLLKTSNGRVVWNGKGSPVGRLKRFLLWKEFSIVLFFLWQSKNVSLLLLKIENSKKFTISLCRDDV